MAKKTPEINSSSTADMAFLLLTFFLMTTTMTTDQGITRQLPPMPPENQPPMDINKRNILLVYVSQSNDIMVGGERMDVSQIAEKVKEFVVNTNSDPSLSEFEITEIDNLGEYPVSKGVVSLKNDKGTNYGTYIAVQNELTRAFNDIRDKVSQQYFSRPFAELHDEQRKAVTLAVPLKISEAEPHNAGGL